jgi:hypothetical protein
VSERKAAAGVALLQKAVLDELQEANGATRRQVAAMFDVEDQETAKTPDGTPLGKVRLDKGKRTARIVNRQSVIDWCATHMPSLLTEPEDLYVLETDLARAQQAYDTNDQVPGDALLTVLDAARRWHAYLRSQGPRDLRSASVKVLTDAALKGGFIDKLTGEITEVPGIEVTVGAPTLYVETDKQYAPQVARDLLAGTGLLAVEA